MKSGTPRNEPRAVTIGDLAALVAGVALAAWLPWSNWPQFVGRRGSGGWAFDENAWAIAAEMLGKACLAMVPVVLVRRAQFKGPLRPGEFLAACGGLYWLAWGVEQHLFRAWMGRRSGRVPDPIGLPAAEWAQWRKLTYWPKNQGEVLMAVAAILIFLAGRKRLPSWALAAAAMLAWIGLSEGGVALFQYHHGLALVPLARAGRPAIADGIAEFLIAFPTLLLLTWPSVVAVLGPRREGRRRTWVQWACILLAMPSFAVALIIRVLIDIRNRPAAEFAAEYGMKALALVLAVGISLWLFGRLDPSRGVGPDKIAFPTHSPGA